MSAWQPNIFDTDDVENNSGELITQAISQGINRLGIKSYKRVKDTHGTFAIMTDKCILCAKSYIYGFMVSCHKQLLEIAEENKLELVMYIQKADKFYKFNPADCLKEGTGKEGTGNRRGESEMWNFKVGFGEDVENPQGRVLIQGKKGQVRLESWFQ